ncbi:MAG: hypothetical protein ACRD1Q_07030 [Vicinamibacterales bacterium]
MTNKVTVRTGLDRTGRWKWVLHMSVSLLVLAPVNASAQVVSTSFEQLQALVKPGDTVDITDTTGRRTRGTLGELSASSLELLARKTGADGRENLVRDRQLFERDVQQIQLVRRDSLWNGTLIGFAPGAAIGMFILFVGAGCDCYTVESRAPIALSTMLFAGGIGALIGGTVDASIVKRTTVYFRLPQSRSAGLHMSPMLSKSGTGVKLAVRF